MVRLVFEVEDVNWKLLLGLLSSVFDVRLR